MLRALLGLNTGLIERKMPDFSFRRAGDFELVAAALYALAMEEQNTPEPAAGPWQRHDGWRVGVPAPRRVSLGTSDGGVGSVSVAGHVTDGPVLVSLGDGPQRTASLQFLKRSAVVLTLGGGIALMAQEEPAAPTAPGLAEVSAPAGVALRGLRT